MTSIQQANPWTPELIQRDKELKEKYGPNAHVIPANNYNLPKADNADKSLVKVPEKDIVEFSKNNDNPNVFSQDKLDKLEKDSKIEQLSYGKANIKNNEADLNIKAKWFGRQAIEGNIGESNVALTMKPNFFNPKKGKIVGSIDGKEVNLPFSYDKDNNLNFSDETNSVSDTIKNNLGLVVNNNLKVCTLRNKILLGSMAMGSSINNNAMLQQQMMNDQINLQNQLFQQQMLQNQMIHQQMHQQSMMSMGMM